MFDGVLRFDTRVDTNGFRNGLRNINSQTNGISKSFGKLKGVIARTLGVAALISFGKKLY